MYAVIKTGGKQYRVKEGDIVTIEKLTAEVGAKIDFDEVLMVGEGEGAKFGTPLVSVSKVSGEVVEHGRGDKIRVIKFRRRKHHMKQQGHRQYFTKVKITSVKVKEDK